MKRLTFPLLTLAWVISAPAAAAPVAATASLNVTLPLLPGDGGGGTITGSGFVDVTGGVITVPAGLVSAAVPLIVPLTTVSAIDALSFVGVSNRVGTFSVGGVTAQVPSELCPGALSAGGFACNVGGGLGGVLSLTGTLNVNVIPGIVVIPIHLGDARLGQGGFVSSLMPPYFPIDAAAWTTGTGLLNTGVDSAAYSGFSAGSTLQLVSPLFAQACGNLLPIIGTFSIELVPEPATWLVLWLGGLGLVRLTRRRG